MDLTGKVALVTGGARGIGRGIVLAMARNGADVAVCDLDERIATSVALEVRLLDRKAEALHLDVTDQDCVDSLVHDVLVEFEHIDILVNNAGIYAAPGWAERERVSEADWDMIYEINVKGVARVTEAVAPHMKQRRYGKVVNISSGAGRQGNPGNPPYHVSKAGVISLTQASAIELAPHNINVNAICPGLLWTPMWELIASHNVNFDETLRGLSPRKAFEKLVEAMIPLGREQTPDDIGSLAAFLASEASRNITGQAINLNGGYRFD